MEKILSYFRLFRVGNLLIIVITQYLIRWCLLKPAYERALLEPGLDEFHFFLLVLATTLTAAAGYVINDYFDLPIDKVNKASKISLGKSIYFKLPIFLHYIICGIAIIIGLYLGWHVNSFSLGLSFAAVCVALWYYSFKYKRMLVWGNLVVSLLTAMVIFIMYLFEFFAARSHPASFIENRSVLIGILPIILGYTAYGFLVSMIREIIKDAEDVIGDEKFGCNTIPIAWGLKNTKHIINGIALFSIITLGYFQWKCIEATYVFLAISLFVAVQIPLLLLILKVISAKEKEDWHFLSQLAKLVMFLGILTTILLNKSLF